ncbi:hypothetical protein F4778DRAFT_746369 [Xylariomycetidae sp. FL2044]|nr:hypothetical protein F4778DRAFT_746369 [Xylariomycetidae sp. FL2044]
MQPVMVLILFLGLLCHITEAILPPRATGTPVATDLSSSILTSLQAAQTAATPSSVEAAFASLSSIYAADPTPNFFEAVGSIIVSGLSTIGIDDIEDYIAGIADGAASDSNTNTREPDTAIFPQASSDDAPYSFSEAKLRGAIHIPSTFQYGAEGAPQPVILVAGTGNAAYVTFSGSWVPLLQDNSTSFGAPVWLNIPGDSLDDTQGNAEYVAYAINYIHGITGQSVAVFGYSQGNVDAHWAYKYWPSTRDKVTDHIGFSPGYHGTILSNLLALIPLPPAWRQSTWTNNFIATLRADGGDSAYVPTTNIYSATDQVDQPQSGDDASGALDDERGVGVSNNLIQTICPGKPGGGFYTHELVMTGPLAYALAKDALANDGPGEVERLDLESVCGDYLAPGLTLGDFLLTENTLVYAGAKTLLYPDKSWIEPAIKDYAK